jgi:radical SAM protein with 4Fe4S-binding SPASM domain
MLNQSVDAEGHTTFFRLADGVRLRREHFGGLVYEPTSGTTIELDKGAFRFVELATDGTSVEKARRDILNERLEKELSFETIQSLAQTLTKNKVVITCPPTAASEKKYEKTYHPKEPWPVGSTLIAPEAAHYAVTFRCNADCPDCYAALHRRTHLEELSTKKAKKAIDVIADWGVFQLAIGGGEPLLRDDLSALIRHAVGRRLAVHLTTGLHDLGAQKLVTLAESLTSLQIGIRHHEMLGNFGKDYQAGLTRTLKAAETLGLRIGANLVLCRSVLNRFEELLYELYTVGLRRLTLLRYKPPSTIEQWKKESPAPSELHGMEERIAEILHRCSELEIRLDCALSFLERKLDPQTAFNTGLRGCVAAARIIAVSPDGSVFPCSQLVNQDFRAGNIIEDSPDSIWREAQVFCRIRRFRETPRFQRSACVVCRAKEFCGGCRVFTHEGFGPDSGCPEAVIVLQGNDAMSRGVQK